MLKQQIAELRAKRARLVAEARALMARREKDGEVDAETEEQVDRILSEVEDLKRRIERLEALVEEEQETEEEAEEPEIEAEPEEDDEEEERSRRRGRRSSIRRAQVGGEVRGRRSRRQTSPEYRSAFDRYLRGQASAEDRAVLRREIRAMSIGTPSKGGHLAPDEFRRILVQRLEDLNVMRQLAHTDTSASGDTQIPVETDIGEAQWIGEGQAYIEEDVEFDQVVISAHKLVRLVKASEELMQDAFFDVGAYLADAFGRSFARAEEKAFIDGTGTGQPLGVVRSSIKGADAAATALSADDIKKLKFRLRAPYRANAAYLMHDTTALAVSLLKDDNGQYLWRQGLAEGEPDTLSGRPLYTSPYMPEIGAGQKSILFGDFSYYWIVDRRELTIQRLVELYAANGQVGFRGMLRVDGKLTLPEAVVHLAHAAA